MLEALSFGLALLIVALAAGVGPPVDIHSGDWLEPGALVFGVIAVGAVIAWLVFTRRRLHSGRGHELTLRWYVSLTRALLLATLIVPPFAFALTRKIVIRRQLSAALELDVRRLGANQLPAADSPLAPLARACAESRSVDSLRTCVISDLGTTGDVVFHLDGSPRNELLDASCLALHPDMPPVVLVVLGLIVAALRCELLGRYRVRRWIVLLIGACVSIAMDIGLGAALSMVNIETLEPFIPLVPVIVVVCLSLYVARQDVATDRLAFAFAFLPGAQWIATVMALYSGQPYLLVSELAGLLAFLPIADVAAARIQMLPWKT